MICGGSSCDQLVDGVWMTSHKLQQSHSQHTSWDTPGGDVLLVGGTDAFFGSTELVKRDGTTEMSNIQNYMSNLE